MSDRAGVPAALPPEENFLGLTGAAGRFDTAKVVILPVPFEATSTFGLGSAAGPEAILRASREVEVFDVALGFEVWQACGGIATLRPLSVGGLDGAAMAQKLAAAVGELLDAGKFVITLGAEHTSIVGAVWAHAAHFSDLTVVQFDAHGDMRPKYRGSAWNHACTMARIRDRCDRLVQVGIRSQTAAEKNLNEAEGLPALYAHEILAESGPAGLQGGWLDRLLAACGPRLYLTFDCDVFDPAIMPATGTPEPGGLSWYQIETALGRLCREREVVGFDLSELAPIPGLLHPQFTAAKLIYRFLGYRFGTP